MFSLKLICSAGVLLERMLPSCLIEMTRSRPQQNIGDFTPEGAKPQAPALAVFGSPLNGIKICTNRKLDKTNGLKRYIEENETDISWM